MKLEEVLDGFRKGKTIRRKEWEDAFNVDYHKSVNHVEIFTISDLISDDWELLEEPGKTFPEVFEEFKNGKKIRRKNWDINAYLHTSNRWPVYTVEIDNEDLLASDWEVIE